MGLKNTGRSATAWLSWAAFIVVVDQLTKLYIVQNLVYRQRIEVLPVLDITRLHNPGAAWSLLADAGGWQRWFFIALGIAVSLLIVYWLTRLRLPAERLLAMALSSILGGAVGNVIDRFVHGHVIDFIHAHYSGHYWPAFNVADMAITLGAGLLIVDTLLASRRRNNS